MKVKHTFLLFFGFVLPFAGYSQIMIGPKAGINISSQFKSDFSVPKLGFMYGGAIDVPIAKGISIQGEFLVTKKGYREEYNGDAIFDELISTYLEIPATAKYTISGVNWGYYGQAGVYWSYWTSGKYQSSVDGVEITFENYTFQKEYDSDGFKDNRNDFGLVIEGGVTYDNLGSGILAMGIRYSHGLVPTNNFESTPPNTQNKLNKVLTISIIYFLFL